MRETQSQPLLPPPPEEAIRVVYHPDTLEFDVFAKGENEPYAIAGVDVKNPEAATKAAADLAQLAVEFGPGEHSSQDIAKALNTTTSSVMQRAVRLARALPADVISYDKPGPNLPTVLKIGDIRVCSAVGEVLSEEQAARAALREGTEAQLERGATMTARLKEETFQRTKARLEQEEATKVDLTARDHAIVRIGKPGEEQQYFITFDAPQSMVLARFIAALTKFPGERLPKGKMLDVDDLKRYMWTQMSLAERRLLVPQDEEDEIYRRDGGGYFRAARMCRALRNIKIGSRPLVDDEYYQGKILVPHLLSTVVLPQKTPPANPYDFRQLVVPPRIGIGPQPNTATVSERKDIVPSAEDLRRAQVWYDRLNARDYPGQQDAIELLNLVMSPIGKAALRQLMPPDVPDEAFEALLERAHRRVRYALGNGAYWPAWRKRLVAGEIVTHGEGGRIVQIGGRLRAEETKAGVGDNDPEPGSA